MPSRELLEFLVVILQVIGVITLLLARLTRGTTWWGWGTSAFIFSLFGLGLSGAACAAYDSEFALFAGGTIAILLHGMILGPIPPPVPEQRGWHVSNETAVA